jgi:hypothetical protein
VKGGRPTQSTSNRTNGKSEEKSNRNRKQSMGSNDDVLTPSIEIRIEENAEHLDELKEKNAGQEHKVKTLIEAHEHIDT